jgi:general secretion pathway protein K
MKHRTSGGFATLLVLWVAAIASVIMVTVEAISATQAVAGREALARVRAAWAARAGLEFAIARAEFDALNPSTSSVFALFDDLAASGEGRLQDSAWRLSYTDQDGDRLGVRDAHEKINLNIATAAQLALLPEMPEDGPDSVADWIDADDDTRPLGAERSFYQSRLYGYKPRNGPFKSVAELELVVGMSAEVVRGEDWNLNGRLDPNEDDGDLSWPPDNADGRLDAGLSAYLTTASVDGGLGGWTRCRRR